MHRRTLAVLAAVLALVLALPSSALALRVHVRVEGATTTIFGAAAPRVTPFTGELAVDGGQPIAFSGPTPLGALEAASRRGEFYFRLTGTSFGPYVSQIGRNAGTDTSGWVFKVNGVSAPVGADQVELEAGDRVLWYWATFGPEGGPPTLDLGRAGRGCYRAYALDDAGKRSAARGVTFRLDDRRIRSRSGRICPRGHWHTLRAEKQGTVRSEVVTRR